MRPGGGQRPQRIHSSRKNKGVQWSLFIMHSHYTFRISHIRSHKGLLKDYFTEHPLVRGEVKEGNSPFGGSLFPTTSNYSQRKREKYLRNCQLISPWRRHQILSTPSCGGEVKDGNSPFGGSLFPTTSCVNLFHLEGHQIFLTTHGNTFLETCSK